MTTADEILKAALNYIRATTLESARETDTPNSLALDSLDRVEIVMAIEEELCLNIDDAWLDDSTGEDTLRQIAETLAAEINR